MHHQIPQPTAEHKQLHAMAGTWTSEETIHPSPWDPKGGTAKGRCEARVALDGFVVVSDYSQEKDGKVCYRGHGCFGYDTTQRKWFMQWLDNMMPVAASTVWGAWEGDTLTFQMQGPQGHHRYTYKFVDDRTYVFSLGMSQDGKAWSTFMEGRFAKKG
jgi:hypothetical protein